MLTEEIINLKNQAIAQIADAKSVSELSELEVKILGKSGYLNQAVKKIKDLAPEERKQTGLVINEAKNTVGEMIATARNKLKDSQRVWFDPTLPGIKQKRGHLHLVTQAIDEISGVFEKIGFVRRRYPEVEWDYFSFTSLNFPKNHPAWDTLETYFVDLPKSDKYGSAVLSPHTSSGQVREMKRIKNPPIRMVNIAKCYRRQSDISHTPMFHQFEGLVVDEGISVVNLKGTLDYFAKNFFGEKRTTRLRPYHFQFTEPSFEVDISCGLCDGKGCRMCKAGWLELGGAGMVHPNVLKEGGIDSKKYSGFAFGWGVERTFMMKQGLSIPDIRMLYVPDLRFLTQF